MNMHHIPATIVAHAFSARAMASNITASDKRVGWVSEPTGRSTSDILWSCFSILLVCTWKCVHFNVPSIEESEAGWLRWPNNKPALEISREGQVESRRWSVPYWPSKQLWWKWAKKVAWLLATVIAPELGVGVAMDQFLRVREWQEENGADSSEQTAVPTQKDSSTENEEKEVGMEQGEVKEVRAGADGMVRHKLTKTHAFFANMGGFTAKILSLSDSQEDKLPTQPDPNAESPLATTGPVVERKPIAARFEETSIKIRDLESLVSLQKVFPDLDIPTEEDIRDLSKADVFTKAFACVQSSWLIIQCIARVSVGLPISQLELATIAFVVCALIMYILWWNKPFGVERKATVVAITYESKIVSSDPDELRFVDEATTYTNWPIQNRQDQINLLDFEGFWDLAVVTLGDAKRDDLVNAGKAFIGMFVKVFRKSTTIHIPRDVMATLTFYFAGTLFSAFHIAAWNWEFPSPVVQTIWRTFAVAATGSGPFNIFIIFAYVSTEDFNHIPDTIAAIILYVSLGVYVICRLGLIVLIFYCFSSMPAGVYETVDWTKYLPYFS